MTIFNLANLGALVRNVVQAICRADCIGTPTRGTNHALRIALAEAEAARDARLNSIMAPLIEAIARVHAKLDVVLAKLEKEVCVTKAAGQ